MEEFIDYIVFIPRMYLDLLAVEKTGSVSCHGYVVF